MADILTRSVGQASIDGTVIYTVPQDGTATLIGCRMTNNTDDEIIEGCYVTLNDTLLNGKATELIPGSTLDIMGGSKIVAIAGDEIKVFAGSNGKIDVVISYLEQTQGD